MNVSGAIMMSGEITKVRQEAKTEKGAASDALRTAIAFLSGDVEGVDPAVTGREAVIAWLDSHYRSDREWWVLLVQDALTRGLTLPLPANEASGEF